MEDLHINTNNELLRAEELTDEFKITNEEVYIDGILNLENKNLTSMDMVDIGEKIYNINFSHNNISEITSMDHEYKLSHINLYDNNIDNIENIETIPFPYLKDHGELWIDESVEYITQ